MTSGHRENLHRWEQIGMLVLGLTHDFNNTATCLLDELVRLERQLRQLRQLMLAAPGAQRAAMTTALDACDRSVETIGNSLQTAVSQTREMQRLYRNDSRSRLPEGFDLVEAAKRALNLLGGRVRVLAQLRSTDPIRVAVGGQNLVRVFMNLLLNAADAFLPEAREPRIRLHMRTEPNRAICDISDNGPGVAPEIRGRLFEPFVTTRAATGGTGLGLAVSRDLVRAEGGELELLQTGPSGTVFRLSLPLLPPDPGEPMVSGAAELVIAPSAPARRFQ
jgi:signal transduction histidine kinase